MASTTVAPHRLTDSAPRATVPPVPRTSGEKSSRIAGRYRYDRQSGDWWWSPEMFSLHGLPPDASQPDTEA